MDTESPNTNTDVKMINMVLTMPLRQRARDEVLSIYTIGQSTVVSWKQDTTLTTNTVMTFKVNATNALRKNVMYPTLWTCCRVMLDPSTMSDKEPFMIAQAGAK